MWRGVCVSMCSSLIMWCKLEAGSEKCWVDSERILPPREQAGMRAGSGDGCPHGWMDGCRMEKTETCGGVSLGSDGNHRLSSLFACFWTSNRRKVKMQCFMSNPHVSDEASLGLFCYPFWCFHWDFDLENLAFSARLQHRCWFTTNQEHLEQCCASYHFSLW